MLNYINSTTLQYPYEDWLLKQDNVSVSFPSEMTDDNRASVGVFPCAADPIPNHNPSIQIVVQNAPVLVEGAWVVGWTVRDKTPEELLADLPYKTAAEAKVAMVEWVDALTARIESTYPAVVRQMWPEEEAMAAAYLASAETAQQLQALTLDAEGVGRTAAEHAARILEKANSFRMIAQLTRRLYLATEKAIDLNQDPMLYGVILEGAIAQAAPLAAAYGLGEVG